MITIIFPDRETEKRALAFLLGRFSGKVLRTGEHLVPEAALEALADQDVPFSVKGRATYEQQVAAIRVADVAHHGDSPEHGADEDNADTDQDVDHLERDPA